jgi:hypothetical protein
MMDNEIEQDKRLFSEELTEELSQTVATLTRFGVTLASLPMALLPREQRERTKRVAGEVLRIGAAVPRAIGTMLEDMSEEWRGDPNAREDLGSRIRKEQGEEQELRAKSEE